MQSGNSVVIYEWEASVWRNELMGVAWNWCLHLSSFQHSLLSLPSFIYSSILSKITLSIFFLPAFPSTLLTAHS